jgi:hypothetical protein
MKLQKTFKGGIAGNGFKQISKTATLIVYFASFVILFNPMAMAI